MTDALAISRKLTAAGVEQKPAEAMAEVVVEHYPEDAATKGDIARLDKRMDTLEKKSDANAAEMKAYIKVLTGLMIATFVTLLALYIKS
jgi:tetrahydromethanopterin S-methyltransferase subunit G